MISKQQQMFNNILRIWMKWNIPIDFNWMNLMMVINFLLLKSLKIAICWSGRTKCILIDLATCIQSIGSIVKILVAFIFIL